MQAVYEQFFFLKYYGGWSFIEAYNLPVGLRTWFVKRLSDQLEKEKQAALILLSRENERKILEERKRYEKKLKKK